ncbi:carboxypeptidase N subunit 2-like [Tenebrio molitor]|uniref:carboxypeptidase N subunit 2-like n=1 Tax=Tenebrio molitor TaxID=7067 RepID=UPI0036246D14
MRKSCILSLIFIILFQKISTQCYPDEANSQLLCKNVHLANVNSVMKKADIKTVVIYELNETKLREEAFQFPNLETLKVSGILEILISNCVSNLVQLKKLDFSYNKISHIPNDLFSDLSQLKEFNISHDVLSNLTLDTFYKLTNVEILDLSYNHIVAIDLGVLDEARSVQKLLLHHNRLTALQLGVFDELVNMILLDVSFNKIADIPLGLFDLPKSVSFLNLSHNNLIQLELGIFDPLKNLSDLTVSHNKLKTVPLGIFDTLTHLKIVSLSGNKLTNVPDGLFDESKKLKKIDLAQNRIQNLSGSLFESNEHLKHLNISYNLITDLDIKIFKQTSLISLDISHNEFQTIKLELLNLKSLQIINAQGNKINYLHPNTFAVEQYISLKHIDFSQNRLVFIEDGFFDWVPNLKRFEISGNPWDCKCLEKVLKQLVARNITYNIEYYFDGRKPACVVANLFDCVVVKNSSALYYKYYNKKN